MLGGRAAGYRSRAVTRTVLLFVVAALTLAGCGGGQEVAPTAEEVQTETQGQAETDNAGGATEGETDTAGDTGESAAPTGNAEAGRAIYDAQGCGNCHTLEEAGSTGTVGPNLDESKPDFELAVTRIANGKSPMPAYKGELSEKQINDVAAFVVDSTDG